MSWFARTSRVSPPALLVLVALLQLGGMAVVAGFPPDDARASAVAMRADIDPALITRLALAGS